MAIRFKSVLFLGLRDEMKFENLEALKSQLSNDAAHAKTILADTSLSFD